MKRMVTIAIATALGLGAIWAGRKAWRASHDIVSIHVRNEPLAKVIRSLANQARESIIADARLDGTVTLDLDSVPLQDALTKIGEQVGAYSSTIHAVHRRQESLTQLSAALFAGARQDPPGWTNIAPVFPVEEEPGGMPQPDAANGPPPALVGAGQLITVDSRQISRRDASGRKVAAEDSAPVVRVRRLGMADGQPQVQEEILIPERIVLATALAPAMHEDASVLPDVESARRLAKKLRAHCTTLYALRQSAVDSGTLRQLRSEGRGLPRPEKRGKEQLTRENVAARAEQEARRAQARRYLETTPEQRAREARNGNLPRMILKRNLEP